MKKQTQPLVSVIMPVHNAGAFLAPAIESILKQTYERFELIIVDDGSTDTSWKTIRTYKQKYPKQIRAYKTGKMLNSAGNGATDFGLMHAKGSFIARMDADDLAKSTRLEKQVAYLLEHSDVILVGSHADIIDAKGKTTGVKQVPLTHEAIYEAYGVVHPIIHPSIMVRRSMLTNQNKLYQHKWGVSDDYYSFFKLLQVGKFANINENLLKYRVHGKNLSLTGIKNKFFNTFYIRIEAIKNMGYQMSARSFIIMFLQFAVVSLIPNIVLETLYPIMRGMDKTPIKKLRHWIQSKISVALSMPLMRRYSQLGK